MKRSKIFSWISARLGQVQTSPWLNANMTKPSIALSKKSSSSAKTSSKKMLGDLPPSSSVTGIRFWLAYCMISRPVDVSPVKAILEMRGDEASGLPASRPKPLTILSTPGGKRSPIRPAHTMIAAGVCSAGFNTTQFPAASAGASFQHAISSGKFHGMICPTTPSGSWK